LGSLGEDGIHPQMNTIGRGSIDGKKIPFNFLYSKRTVKCERVGDGALLPIWGDDKHIPHITESLCQDDDTFRMDSIIIGNQNLQLFGHISYRKWSGREDLNLRHLTPHASALPGCATPRFFKLQSPNPCLR
jgi:hypothetical protein